MNGDGARCRPSTPFPHSSWFCGVLGTSSISFRHFIEFTIFVLPFAVQYPKLLQSWRMWFPLHRKQCCCGIHGLQLPKVHLFSLVNCISHQRVVLLNVSMEQLQLWSLIPTKLVWVCFVLFFNSWITPELIHRSVNISFFRHVPLRAPKFWVGDC